MKLAGCAIFVNIEMVGRNPPLRNHQIITDGSRLRGSSTPDAGLGYSQGAIHIAQVETPKVGRGGGGESGPGLRFGFLHTELLAIVNKIILRCTQSNTYSCLLTIKTTSYPILR